MTREERRLRWRRLIEKQAESGLSAAAFCKERDLNLHQFYRWRQRLQSEVATNPSGSFLELVPSSGEQESGVRIRLPGDVCIEVERGFDTATLVAVLRTLGQPCLP